MAYAPSGPSDEPPRTSIMAEAGQKLKQIRERLGLKYREVEEATTRIANQHQNDELIVSLSRLADIENKGTVPSMYRLYSLCAVYRLDMTDALSWYGISLSLLPADALLLGHPKTHMIGFKARQDAEVQSPISLDPGIDLSKTMFLSRMIQKWGKLPLMLLRHMDLRSRLYGLIGTDDWSMFPIIPPGSLVVIDDSRRRILSTGWRSEFDRPIYFLEHREGYMCGWCSLEEDKLSVQFHPSSGCAPGFYTYPDEIEVIGQVTQVAMTLEPSQRNRPRK
jgi:transcriptional regulator with XRE-family HTH domain